MIIYSPAKINIGLKVLNKRPDGFHNIDSYFYPVPLYDLIEYKISDKDELLQTGFVSTVSMEENLVYKALVELRKLHSIPPLKIHLHKQIPFQAGLGGGSGDAISFIKQLNIHLKLELSEEDWKNIAAVIGSDCPFFIQSKPSKVSGRGETVETLDWSLSGTYIIIVKPDFSIKTANAFTRITLENETLPCIKNADKKDYKNLFPNQFEGPLLSDYPEIQSIKEELIKCGAFYASLSGSGSAVFGLFETEKKIKFPHSYFQWSGKLK